jgi:alpha-L-arabinofuranosidase
LPDIDRWNREVFSVAAAHSDAAALNWFFPGAIGRLLRDNEADALQMTAGSDVFATALDRVITDLDSVGDAASSVPIYVAEWGRQVTFPEGLLSDNHRLYDGVFYAGCFNRLIERSRRVRMAGFAHLVNASAPIQTFQERHFVTAAYLVTQLYHSTCRPEHVAVTVKSESMFVPALEDIEKAFYVCEMARRGRQAPILDAAATADELGTTVYLSNRGIREPITVELSGVARSNQDARFSYVTADSPYTVNTVDAPNAIRMAETAVAIRDGRATVTIPPCTAGALIVGAISGSLASR